MPRDNVIYTPGVPVEQEAGIPDEQRDGWFVHRTHVATELGVKIYFDTNTRDFRAKLPGGGGRGSVQELHSADFGTIVERIRQRALVVPVQGYLLSVSTPRYTSRTDAPADPVELEPCEIIEHHPTRHAPFIVRLRGEVRGKVQVYTRACGEVYIPTPPQVDALRQAAINYNATVARHAQELDEAARAVASARNALSTVDVATLRNIQQTGEQAIDPSGLGLPVFTMEDDDDANDDAEE